MLEDERQGSIRSLRAAPATPLEDAPPLRGRRSQGQLSCDAIQRGGDGPIPKIHTLRAYPGLDRTPALRNGKLRQFAEEGALQLSLCDVKNLAEIRSPCSPDERLVACFDPLLAEERRRKRGELLAATEAALTKIQREVQRCTKTPLRAEGIGQKVARVIIRHKMSKHFDLTIADSQFRFARRSEAIRQ